MGEEEAGSLSKRGWQRRTLPPRLQGSTIRAHELNDRVRDGAGWTLMALATNTDSRCAAHSLHTHRAFFPRALCETRLHLLILTIT